MFMAEGQKTHENASIERCLSDERVNASIRHCKEEICKDKYCFDIQSCSMCYLLS